MIAERKVQHVVLYTFDAAEEFLTIARDIGVSGVVLKSATGDVLATALERVVAGERVGLDDVVRATAQQDVEGPVTSRTRGAGTARARPNKR
jgi:DNA-binding NarL/FixJ family response regulator